MSPGLREYLLQQLPDPSLERFDAGNADDCLIYPFKARLNDGLGRNHLRKIAPYNLYAPSFRVRRPPPTLLGIQPERCVLHAFARHSLLD